MLPKQRRLFLTFGALVCVLIDLPSPAARAENLKLLATLGIGGRYRPGTWLPVTVTVVNTGSDPIHGQVQVYAADPAGGPGDMLFACPADVAASGPAAQTFQVYVRDLDPGRTDVVAQLVSGAERGDGPVLAKISSLSNTSRSFSGIAIADNDLFLIGLSSDTSAFSFLNGRKWGLMHTSSGITLENTATHVPNASPAASAATVQTAAASPADLPDKPGGYGGVDAVLLRADAPLDALSEAQTDALKAWVSGGGHLIVCGGPDPSFSSNAFFAGLLPADVGPMLTLNDPGVGPVPALALAPKPLPGVHVVTILGGHPAVVDGPFGAGRVTLVAFDPTAPAFRGGSSPTETAFWTQVLSGGSASLLGVVASREEGDGSRYMGYYGGAAQLSDAVMRAPSLDAPGAGVVGLFLLSYVLILVPINYLVLKRLDKKEWAWVTIPVLVAVFAITTYGVGYAAKGSSVFVNRAAIVEAASGERQAGVYTEVGLFSPHRTAYDLTVADPNALAAIPVPPDDYSYYGRRSPSSADNYGQTRFVETSGDTKVQDAAVNMWAMRSFDLQTTTDLGGAFASTLTENRRTWTISGTLSNHTAHGLTECHLFINGQWLPVADLPSGASVTVTGAEVGPGSYNSANGRWDQMPTILGRNDKNDPESDVRQRMRAALADFVRDVGSDPNGGQGPLYGANFATPALFLPHRSEALLTGWSTDESLSGPSLRVDGHPVTQNNVTFVVVHIPLP